jgi:hypothetical protein
MKNAIIKLINPIIPLVIYLVGCNTTTDVKRPAAVDTIKSQRNNTNSNTVNTNATLYAKAIASIRNTKARLFNTYKYKDVPNYNDAGKQFIHLFENVMLPHWIGTKWDYNGTTQLPQQGAIACGYFVSTTLQQMQVNIDRVKYGQAASEITMLHVTTRNYYKNYSNLSFEKFIQTLKNRPPFLAIIGLDKHTGYILNNGKELYFIHSTYVQRKGVIKQKAALSPELKSNKWRSVAFLTDDNNFIRKWLTS